MAQSLVILSIDDVFSKRHGYKVNASFCHCLSTMPSLWNHRRRRLTRRRKGGAADRRCPSWLAVVIVWVLLVLLHTLYSLSFTEDVARLLVPLDDAPACRTDPLMWDALFQSARHDSFGFFDDLPHSAWQQMRRKAQNFSRRFHARMLPNRKARFLYMNNLQPVLTCRHVRRLGGWWTCDPHRIGRGTAAASEARRSSDALATTDGSGSSSNDPPCLVYSFHAGPGGLPTKTAIKHQSDDVYAWERAILEETSCQIHIFDDHAERLSSSMASLSERAVGHSWSLKSSQPSNSTEPIPSTAMTFAEIQEHLGHGHQRLEILKLDCGGCEWSTVNDWIAVESRQILIMVHGSPTLEAQPTYSKETLLTAWQNGPGSLSNVSTAGRVLALPRRQRSASKVSVEQEFFDTFLQHGYAMFSKDFSYDYEMDSIEFGFLRLHADFWNASVVPSALNHTGDDESTLDSLGQLAKEESLGYLEHISDASWHRMKERARDTSVNVFDKASTRDSATFYVNHAQPFFTCPHVERVGGYSINAGHGDGPKWVCDPDRLLARPDCLIYSIGSNGDYGFEDNLFTRFRGHCEIHVFDPGHFARANDPTTKNIHYHAWGLESVAQNSHESARVYNTKVNQGTMEFKTFPETIKQLGHDNRTIDILKVDCEGCEWSTFVDWIQFDIRQVLVELHGIPTRNGAHWTDANITPFEFFDTFKAHNYAMFSREANPWSPGQCYEFAFLKVAPSFWNVSTTNPGCRS